ncbi:MLO-like protein 6 [Neltuma alba]|uniref:MLO-like protein 6 n=1 Tax=Neltuma alba TaxID=207710 RepID=UPI0010A43FAD|nr:MLO-like protein 6 [Prosopis alba]
MVGVSGGRNLEETPTWAVALVCFVLILISIIIEHILHLIGKWLKKKHKSDLYESLEKIKSELMLLGFISLLLTVGQDPISRICVSEQVAGTWHPCSKREEVMMHEVGRTGAVNPRRVLAAGGSDKCTAQGKVPLVSPEGIHQLHIFIFVWAGFHVLCCILTLALARVKMRSWKRWEEETRTSEYQSSHDPERFRFARETSFGRRHLSFWTQTPVPIWIVCFFRQFVRSVPKVDYLALRHGFIMAHLAPQNQEKFDFRKYIGRSLEEDFKFVVGLSPPFWFFAAFFLLFNTHGWYSYLWFPFIPLIIILVVGTKLQVIITKMAQGIQQKGEVVKGEPVVEPGDDLFWFKRPRLILYLINFVLFQNAFQLAFFAWTVCQFGLKSCFNSQTMDVVIRISMGVFVQILCSYVTLPLYALVTQMGSTMRPTIFDEKIAMAIRSWHMNAKQQVRRNRGSASVTPLISRPTSPSNRIHHHRTQGDSSSSQHSSSEDGSSLYRQDLEIGCLGHHVGDSQ